MSDAIETGNPLPEEAVRIRAKPPQPKRLSRKVLLAGTGTAGLVVAFALLSGLSERPDRRGTRSEEAPASAPSTPEALRALPARYDSSILSPRAEESDEPRDMLWGEQGPPEGFESPARLDPPDNQFWAQAQQSVPQRSPAVARAAEQAADAASAPIFFGPRREGARVTPIAAQVGETDQAIEGGGRREGFIARQRGSADVLDSPYIAPSSPYLLQAGAVIPAALVTALNSDLPGRVIAQVTAPVYDSISGDHLLIPQGARLIGTYDSANAGGDNRLFLVWNRIIMPNGWSLQLAGMEATDPSGAAGLSDRTDNHLGRLAGAIGLSAVLSILANQAQIDRSGNSQQLLTQSIGNAAAQETARVGGKIVDRELDVQPTLRVRPGAPVRVLVTRDIQLSPYPP